MLEVTHYSEGSVQPVILQRLFTDLVPNVLPFFIRPIARIIFNKMDDLIVKRDLERHGKLVGAVPFRVSLIRMLKVYFIDRSPVGESRVQGWLVGWRWRRQTYLRRLYDVNHLATHVAERTRVRGPKD